MLTGNSEQELLNRISLARGTSEPESEQSQVEPTDNPEQENPETEIEEVQDESQEQEPEESTEEEAEKTEELESDTEEDESEVSDDNDPVYAIGEIEITESELKELKSGAMMQSDYSKKTSELAEQRKAFEVEQAEAKADLQSKLQQVNAIIQQDSLSNEQLAELKDDDPEAYIAYQEKMKARKELINSSTPRVDKQAVSDRLVEANPHWLEDGKPTEAFTKDMGLVKSYASELGYSPEELAGIEQNGDSHHWLTFLDAARGREAIKELAALKSSAETKRTRKPPVVTKSKGKGTVTHLDRQIKAAKDKLKQTGHERDAFAYRKLLKQRGKTNGSTS